MAVLAETLHPTIGYQRPRSSSISAVLAPAFSHSLYLATALHSLVSATTLFLCIRAYVSSLFLLRQSLYVSHLLAIQSYYATALVSRHGYYASAVLGRQMYPVFHMAGAEIGKGIMHLRRKLVYEVVTFVLGGGNQVFLVIFWPGWLVIGGIWWICT